MTRDHRRKPATRRRDHDLRVPVTPDERRAVEAAADAARLTLAEWMRRALARAAQVRS